MSSDLRIRIHPSVILSILDCFIRHNGQKRTKEDPEKRFPAIGILLGSISDGNVVEVTDCIPVGDSSNVRHQLSEILELKSRINPKEVVIGTWVSQTGDDLETALTFNSWLQTKDGFFTPQHPLNSALMFVIDSSVKNGDLPISAFLPDEAEKKFLEVEVDMLEDDPSALLMLARARQTTAGKTTASDCSNNEAIKAISAPLTVNEALDELSALLGAADEYVTAVVEGKINGDVNVCRLLHAALSAKEGDDILSDRSKLEKLVQTSQKDAEQLNKIAYLCQRQGILLDSFASFVSSHSE